MGVLSGKQEEVQKVASAAETKMTKIFTKLIEML